MRELCIYGLTSRLREHLGVVLVQRYNVILLLETILSNPSSSLGKCVFIELLQAYLFLVGALEGCDSGVGGCQCGLELGDGGLVGFLYSCVISS